MLYSKEQMDSHSFMMQGELSFQRKSQLEEISDSQSIKKDVVSKVRQNHVITNYRMQVISEQVDQE